MKLKILQNFTEMYSEIKNLTKNLEYLSLFEKDSTHADARRFLTENALDVSKSMYAVGYMVNDFSIWKNLIFLSPVFAKIVDPTLLTQESLPQLLDLLNLHEEQMNAREFIDALKCVNDPEVQDVANELEDILAIDEGIGRNP